MQKNVASQKWVVFAFDRTDNTPKAGDAAQITAKIAIDGAAANGTNDVNPTEIEDGYYAFDLTQAETNGETLHLLPESSTGNVQVIGVPGVVTTTPASWANTIAAINTDTGTNLSGQLTTIDGIVDIIQASVRLAGGTIGATGNDITHLHLTGETKGNDELNGHLIVVYDVSEDEYHVAVITDWVLATELATVLPLNGSVLPFTPQASTDTYQILSTTSSQQMWTHYGTRVLTAATNITSDGSAITMSSSGVVGTVNLLNTTTTNTDMRGTDSAALATALTTAQNDLDTITGSDGVTLATAQANYAPATAAALATAQTDLDTITGTDGVTLATAQALYAPATAAALATAQTDLDTITGTDGVTLATAQALYAPATAAQVNAEVVDVVNVDALVAGVDIAEAMRRIGAIVGYKLSGAGTGTETVVDWADSANTIVFTVDGSGNKSAVTFN